MSHPDQDKKYVVYHEPRGKTPKGIYHVKVLLTKDHAIVPTGRGVVGDILPRGNVFETRQAAEKCLQFGGLLRWVILPGDMYQGKVPRPVRARVVTFSERTGYSSARYEENTYVFPLGTDECIRLDPYRREQYVYAHKTEAERQHAILWNEAWNEAWTELTKNDLALTETMTALRAAKPRSRKKKKA